MIYGSGGEKKWEVVLITIEVHIRYMHTTTRENWKRKSVKTDRVIQNLKTLRAGNRRKRKKTQLRAHRN